MEKIAQYQGRPLGVVEELNACFSNGETAFHRKLSEIKKIKGDSNIRNEKRRTNPGFCWIRMLFNPWKWKRAAGVTAKLILISASISSTARFCQGGLFSCSSRRKVLSLLKPIDSRTEENSTALSLSNSPLDVFYGRGWIHYLLKSFILLFFNLFSFFPCPAWCYLIRINQKEKLCVFE